MKLPVMLLVLASSVASADMSPLSNDDMDKVSGQQGVAIALDWRLNADASGTPLGLCTAAATYRECRIAWSFNNRGWNGIGADTGDLSATNPKKWLVLKGLTGALYIPYLSVDASSVTYTNTSSVSKTIPAVLVSFGDSANAFSGANTKVQIKNLVIDNMSFETDSTTVPGAFRDATTEPAASGGAAIPAGVNAGFMGLQISGPGNVANVQIDGTIKLFSVLSDNPLH